MNINIETSEENDIEKKNKSPVSRKIDQYAGQLLDDNLIDPEMYKEKSFKGIAIKKIQKNGLQTTIIS